ncbi:MAG: hypothetical protein N3E46_00895 [Gemmataceae bacterium]|uniref:Zinc finger/thioredoxin putative domain-containing protein n=1 Tax=Thermogemmata fonticola TaxID=2755323 RepID=A0A7V9AAZ4_9BACT|nr:MJ0042-type zinc finger domain-containing protein [Thermogemmata fonticola]MBA2225651.1 hypothetical protein [Thermogemmata fonticola]MCX8138225.1 hypothetical protein [Gemmataceae bacterium]
MPISQTCPQCRVRLRVPDEKVGQAIRCPKCGHSFPVTLLAEPRGHQDGTGDNPVARTEQKPTEQGPGWEVIDRASSPPLVAQVVEDEDESVPLPTKPRKSRKAAKKADSLETVKVVGGVIAAILGVIGGVYLLLVFLGFAGTASSAYGELCDIFETAATALEDARQPQKRSAAAQKLSEQAKRLQAWTDKYKDAKAEEAAIKAALRRYEERMEKALVRVGIAEQQLQDDPEAMKDPNVSQAVRAWRVALLGLASQTDPLHKFKPSRR